MEDMGVKRGESATTTDVQTFTISAAIHDRLQADMMLLPSPYTGFELHCQASTKATLQNLPASVIAALQDFRYRPDSPGVIWIRGLPTDPELPETPVDGKRNLNKLTFISEGCLTGFTQIVGEIFSYASEKDGELIHNICPVSSGETTQSNESSRVDLNLHVEDAYFAIRPDCIALYCLRQDVAKEAITYTADARSALARMTPLQVKELHRPVFIVPSPASHHDAHGEEKWSQPRPLISVDTESGFIYHSRMKAIEDKAHKVLERFVEVLNHVDVVKAIALEPGSLVLINNRKVAHGRTSFKAFYNGTDRWLQRVYVTTDVKQRAGTRDRVMSFS